MPGNLRRLGPLKLVSAADGSGTGYIGDGTGNNVAQSEGVTGKVVAIQYVPDGTIPASTLSEAQVPLVNERIKVVLASAGNAKQGQWFAIVE